MPYTLLLRLAGPLQAWGVSSRFSIRETLEEKDDAQLQFGSATQRLNEWLKKNETATELVARQKATLEIVASLEEDKQLLKSEVMRLTTERDRGRALEEALVAQVQRSRRSGEPFCVLMLDADHFKTVNDRHGHAVGDLALKHLAALLLGHMRAVDQLARFGGEEFLVMLPGLVLADALPVAERLRAVVAAAPLPLAGASIKLSVSIGMAEWGGAHEEPSRLLVRADAALYHAKRHGRDRVALAGADPLIA